MSKKLIIAGVVLIFCTGFLFSQTAVAPSSGDGSEENPYQISSLENLFWISEDASRWANHYIQTADINALGTISWFPNGIGGYYGFPPIGNWNDAAFTGSYDGQLFSINNLFEWRGDMVGLFGYTQGATISNIVLFNVQISGNAYVGGLVGYANYSTSIINCLVSGSIMGRNNNVGGLVGDNHQSSTISNCYTRGSVEGNSTVGGLVGSNSNSSIINNSFSRSSVLGEYVVGGLAGANITGAAISNSYSSGLVTGTNNRFVGGFVGYPIETIINNCYWDIQTSGVDSSVGGIGKTTLEMKSFESYSGWNFTNIWTIDSLKNSGYPVFLWSPYSEAKVQTNSIYNITGTSAIISCNVEYIGNPTPAEYGVCWNTTGAPEIGDSKIENIALISSGSFENKITGLNTNTLYYVRAFASNELETSYGGVLNFSTLTIQSITPTSGDGTISNPYQINCLANLLWISEDPNRWSYHYIQTENINATETSTWFSHSGGSLGWSPIGNIDVKFTGSYNGGNNEINGLYINRPTENYVGMFGLLNQSSINNIKLNNLSIIGGNYTAGISGNNGSYSIIKNCTINGTIIGNSYVGGVSGQNDYSAIEKCANFATINASSFLGGLSGNNYNSSSIINSYNSGAIEGSGRVGGLVGFNNVLSIISNCYSCGQVNGTYPVGGLVGQNDNASVNNSFWDTQTSSQTTSSGGTGLPSVNMKTQTTYSDAGWQFPDIWAMNDHLNNGYPYLYWEYPDVEIFDIMTTNSFSLSQNYPNPFNPTTALKYGLPEASDVNLMIFDITGRRIKEWSISNQQAGWHEVVWNGTNQSGQQVSTGVYIYCLRAGNFVDTKKMVFMK